MRPPIKARTVRYPTVSRTHRHSLFARCPRSCGGAIGERSVPPEACPCATSKASSSVVRSREALVLERRGLSASLKFFQLCPRPPGVPAFLKLRLGLFQGWYTIGACHRRVNGQRPEPAQMVGTATGLIDAADIPLAAVDGEVLPVLVDPGARPVGRSVRGITNAPQTV